MIYKQVVQHGIKSNASSSDIANIDANVDSYLLVDKRFLHLNDKINFSLYSLDTYSQMTLFLQSKSVLDKTRHAELQRIENLYTYKREKHKYEELRKSHLDDIIEDESLSMDEKTQIVYESTTKLSSKIFENPAAMDNMKVSKDIVNPILKSVFHSEDTIASYVKIIEYDYYTHTHSLNVSIYALCLGVALGLDEQNARDLGRAALLHDLGKSKIEHSIVNKDGTLTSNEYEQMQMHSVLGYELALKIGITDKNMLDGIRHHHEKLDGSGYPDKLKGKEIGMFPRIIGICDIFDALTTRRSYKEAMGSYDALHMMKLYMGGHLDMKILNTFIKILHK